MLENVYYYSTRYYILISHTGIPGIMYMEFNKANFDGFLSGLTLLNQGIKELLLKLFWIIIYWSFNRFPQTSIQKNTSKVKMIFTIVQNKIVAHCKTGKKFDSLSLITLPNFSSWYETLSFICPTVLS